MDLSSLLLSWYDIHGRSLPWRFSGGVAPDPYCVWLSEMMLQQTGVVVVGRYFCRFMELWPSVYDLASASIEDVLREWAGLGYYARARYLHRCAGIIVRDYGGVFPCDELVLRSLPGIGPYSAAAICSIAFNMRSVAIDGNIERVISRVFCMEEMLPSARSRIYDLADSLIPGTRCGDYTQALMDLGALICTVRSPNCSLCPWQDSCLGYSRGIAEDLPKKRKKSPRPTRFGVVFWVAREDGHILLRRRPEHGLLGGMYEIPSSDWHGVEGDDYGDDSFVTSYISRAPIADIEWQYLEGHVSHIFTHFRLYLRVLRGVCYDDDIVLGPEYRWVSRGDLPSIGLPSLMRKVCAHVLGKNWYR